MTLYERIAETIGNKRKSAAETSQTGKAGTNCIFFGNQVLQWLHERESRFSTLTLYIAKVSIFVSGREKGRGGEQFSRQNFKNRFLYVFLRIQKRPGRGRAGKNIA